MKKRLFGTVLIISFTLLLVHFGSDQRALSANIERQSNSLTSPRAANAGQSAVVADAEITLTEIIPGSAGLSWPTDIANAGDKRLFIVEKAGRIHVFDGASVLPTPFLDITTLVDDGGGEAGLLGLAFHPNYAANGYFYVNYTHRRQDSKLITRVERYIVSFDNPNVANPQGLVILEFEQDQGNHNGGDLNFGPLDGYLYMSTGDGGKQGDPLNRAQDDTQLLGKILRINIDAVGGAECDTSGSSNYAIPPTNPLRDGAGGNCDEIWADGLRNPWRFSFDRGTADMWTADVGYADWEEVNFQPASSSGGENYGWRCYEGKEEFDTSLCGAISEYIFPEQVYAHGGTPRRCSVTGGFVYRGTAVPALRGHYFYADYCSSEFWSISGRERQISTYFGLPVVPGGAFSLPTTFGEDMYGEIYVAEGGSNASIFRISSTNLLCDFCKERLFIPLLFSRTS